MNGELDMGQVNLAANRIRAYLTARNRPSPGSDIVGLHAPSASILSVKDLQLVLAALPSIPTSESDMLERAMDRLATRNATKRSAGAVDWVDCPVCKESDMRRTTDEDGHVLIDCVNHGCLSNGGTMHG